MRYLLFVAAILLASALLIPSCKDDEDGGSGTATLHAALA